MNCCSYYPCYLQRIAATNIILYELIKGCHELYNVSHEQELNETGLC